MPVQFSVCFFSEHQAPYNFRFLLRARSPIQFFFLLRAPMPRTIFCFYSEHQAPYNDIIVCFCIECECNVSFCFFTEHECRNEFSISLTVRQCPENVNAREKRQFSDDRHIVMNQSSRQLQITNHPYYPGSM